MSEKRVGRPRSPKPLDTIIKFRVDAETRAKLTACAEALHTTSSDIIRRGIDRIYESLPRE